MDACAGWDLASMAQTLSTWLSRQQGAPVRVHDLQSASGGYSNLSLIGTAHGGLDAEIVVRVQTAVDGVFPRSDIALQAACLQALADSAVPVPRLLGIENDARVLNAPFYVMQRVPGRVPNENPLYHQQGWLHDLPAQQQRRHWLGGLEVLAALCRVDWRMEARVRRLAGLLPPEGQSPLAYQLQQSLQHLQWVETFGFRYPALHSAHDWLLRHQPPETAIVLQWGDAKLGNCVFDETGRVAAALDWETASLGAPVADLAWWLVHDEALSAGYGVPRLPGLPTHAESVTHWEQASGCRADHLAYYEVLAAWRFAIIMARIGTLFTQRGWVPASAQMDVNNGAAAVLRARARHHGFATH